MASIADAQDLQVRSLSGELWLSLPRQELAFEGLRVVDLKRRLHEEAHGYASELQLIVGQRALEDEDLLEAAWLEEGGPLVVHILGGILPRARRLEMERVAQSLLESLLLQGLEAFSAAVERMAETELRTHLELAVVSRALLSRALLEPHHHELLAGAAAVLSEQCPDFPAEVPDGPRVAFHRVLLNAVQEEFESLTAAKEPAEGSAETSAGELAQERSRLLATVGFIGQLFLRRFVAQRVLGQVVHDLIGLRDVKPREHEVVCACKLLEIAGAKLRGCQAGRALMGQICNRLRDLQRSAQADGLPYLSEDVRLRIQRLVEAPPGVP
mmetsp:Transcript_56518/g.175321  ORF Transcript_56518/g.175321 Transcript_56518/m.175321 type:complete len:327 (+) Transcript_56518:54-1034(+)